MLTELFYSAFTNVVTIVSVNLAICPKPLVTGRDATVAVACSIEEKVTIIDCWRMIRNDNSLGSALLLRDDGNMHFATIQCNKEEIAPKKQALQAK